MLESNKLHLRRIICCERLCLRERFCSEKICRENLELFCIACCAKKSIGRNSTRGETQQHLRRGTPAFADAVNENWDDTGDTIIFVSTTTIS